MSHEVVRKIFPKFLLLNQYLVKPGFLSTTYITLGVVPVSIILWYLKEGSLDFNYVLTLICVSRHSP